MGPGCSLVHGAIHSLGIRASLGPRFKSSWGQRRRHGVGQSSTPGRTLAGYPLLKMSSRFGRKLEERGVVRRVEPAPLRSRCKPLWDSARRQVAPHDDANEHHQRPGEARYEGPGRVGAESDVLKGVDHRDSDEPGEEAQGVSQEPESEQYEFSSHAVSMEQYHCQIW